MNKILFFLKVQFFSTQSLVPLNNCRVSEGQLLTSSGANGDGKRNLYQKPKSSV